MTVKLLPKQKLSSKPFITLKTSSNVIKMVSVLEISKIIINKERLEVVVLFQNGDKDTVKFSTLEELEEVYKKLFMSYCSVFVG